MDNGLIRGGYVWLGGDVHERAVCGNVETGGQGSGVWRRTRVERMVLEKNFRHRPVMGTAIAPLV